MLNVYYSGSQKVKQPKKVVVNHPTLGTVRCVTDVIHKFKIPAIQKGMSLISFIQLDKNVFISANTFSIGGTGRHYLELREDLAEHTPLKAVVVFVQNMLDNPSLKEWKYETDRT